MVLLAARYPKDLEEERNRHIEADAEHADAIDRAADPDADIWEEEGFFVEDEEVVDDGW